MSIPVTGLLLIPLGLLIAALPWRYCLIGLMIFAMLSPAAVVNAGGFGLQPGYFLALLLIGRTVMEIASRGFTLNSAVLTRMGPLLLFLTIAFVVLFIALAFFHGQVDTLPGTAGFKSNAVRPFRIARENYTQIVYLMLNLLLIYVLGHQAARENFQLLVKAWDTAFVLALVLSAAVCFWQFASQFGGPAFPSEFFYSNVGYARAENQTMAGFLRVSGPFEEPSTVGYVFTGFLLFAWLRYRLYPTALSAVLIAACILSMMISTSTTAFFGLFLFACVSALDVAMGRIKLLTRTISSGQTAIIAILALGLAAGLAVAAAKGPEIYVILKNTVFDKSESSSFQERSFADLQAMRILIETYGFGIGLGSHKANSLVLTLLSNTGIAGLLVFAAFLYTLLRWPSADTELRRATQPFQWGVIGLILIHAFSNPNLSAQLLWVQMGGLLALQVAMRKARDGVAVPQTGIAEAQTGRPYAV